MGWVEEKDMILYFEKKSNLKNKIIKIKIIIFLALFFMY